MLVSNSVFTLTAIAIEQYGAVMNPLKKKRLSRRRAKQQIAIIWFLSVFICTPTWLAWKVEMQWDPLTGQNTLPRCNNSNIIKSQLYGKYSTFLSLILYFIPLCIISYAYLRMALELNGKIPEIENNAKESRLCNKTVRQNKRKVKRFNARFDKLDGQNVLETARFKSFLTLNFLLNFIERIDS